MLWLIFLPALLLMAGGTVWIFRHGARQQFISAIPFGKMVFGTIILGLLPSLLGWLRGEPVESWAIQIVLAAAIFVCACIVWLIGFFFGRVRAARREGIVRSR